MSPLQRGQPWGRPAARPPDLVVDGDDARLAAAVAAHPGALVRFLPSGASDLARAVGIPVGGVPDAAGPGPGALEVPIDALRADGWGLAVNAVVVGVPPPSLRWWSRTANVRVEVDGTTVHDGPATTVVVANGQYVRGLDVVPRGHPGDGRAEVQVYRLRARERAAMRARLATGTHLPHARIVQRTGTSISVASARALRVELDGHVAGSVERLEIAVLPAAVHLVL